MLASIVMTYDAMQDPRHARPSRRGHGPILICVVRPCTVSRVNILVGVMSREKGDLSSAPSKPLKLKLAGPQCSKRPNPLKLTLVGISRFSGPFSGSILWVASHDKCALTCPDARERAGPVFPPPPHSPTNFEWRVCLGKSCRYVDFNKNMSSRATSKSCFMALALKLSHLLERGQISLTGIWNVSRSAITFCPHILKNLL